MTPRQLIRFWADRFQGAGIPDPVVDAAALLSHVTGQPALALRLDTSTQLTDAILAAMRTLAEERLGRRPLQYILGDQSFMGHRFQVNEAVLIPRPETELLCEQAIRLLKELPRPRTALDLCCGTGCIGISIQIALPDAAVTCTDLSAEALAVCKENARRLGADVTLLQGNLFDPVHGRFSAVVSNPPYIPSGDCGTLQPEVTREPRLALDGGADGLDFYRRIAKESRAHLLPEGCLLLEIGCDQADDVSALLRAAGFAEIAVSQDFSGLDRIITARISGGADEGTV